ncbi:MAG: cytochrome c biogenesis protein CcsA [Deltaproteobacteria bacterium]|nr:cytochrome c biogenesis protein CcsA [Deltaproteobacteria bacterium]
MTTFWTLYYAALILTALLFAVSLSAIGRRRLVYRCFSLSIVIVLGAAIALRWQLSGHPPILGVYEATLVAAWTIILYDILFDRAKGVGSDNRSEEGVFARYSSMAALITLLYGLLFDTDVKPLVISEQSWWVYFHALFSWIAYGFYMLSLFAAIFVILQERGAKTSDSSDSARSLVADWALHRGLLYGFVAQTIFFVLGSYYSTLLHGAWWVWDSVEYLFVMSWFLYAIAIHGRIFFAWKSPRVALWVVAAFVVLLAMYWGLSFIPWATYHIFDPGIKVHVG